MEKKNLVLYAVKKGGKYHPEDYKWEYCVSQRIPYILINPDDNYCYVDVNLDTIDAGLTFPDHMVILELWQNFYNGYCLKYELPDKKKGYTGSSTYFGITIWSKDYKWFTNELFHYIMEVIKEHGKINDLLTEYTETVQRMNKMTTNFDDSIPYDEDEYERLEKKMGDLSKKMNERD